MPDSLDVWLERIGSLHPESIALGLDRVRTVAQRMALSPGGIVFTVAGTNGKGSSCAMLEAILISGGYRVGLYTSPHLLRFNERIRVGGAEAADEVIVAAFEAVEAARADTPLTYFEFSTLAALHVFSQQRLDAVILEVGLGGRLDAVNLIDADCALVTSIDVDHSDYLGNTRERIALEKAHIFRPGRPAICSDPLAPATLVEYAEKIGADLWLCGRDFRYVGDMQQWSYRGRVQRRSSLAYPALRGANQLLNASGVLAALEAMRLRIPVTQQAVRQGLALVELPGRLQVLPGLPTIVLDVAHNPHAVAHLATNLDAMDESTGRSFAVFGALRDKDVDGMIETVRDRFQRWYLTDLPGPRGASAQWLAERLRHAGIGTDGAADGGEDTAGESGEPVAAGAGTSEPAHPEAAAAAAGAVGGADAGDRPTARRDGPAQIECHPDPTAALIAACAHARTNDRITVFGSFLTVADILASRARAEASSRRVR